MLHAVALGSLLVALASAVLILVDEARHPQAMAVMNAVWPLTALYGSIFALWAYFRQGRRMARGAMQGMSGASAADHHHPPAPNAGRSPTWTQAAIAGSHCGAGCVLADIVTEFAIFALGATILGSELYASFVWDLMAAWLVGIGFQYFAIRPMSDLTAGGALWAAVRADTLSIVAFQIGMYGWMALVFFRLFPGHHLHPDDPAYWFMMQVAMIGGFITALPVNWLLLKIGVKEAMG